MKSQALFSSKDKSKKINMLSAAILLGTLRVNLSFLCVECIPVCVNQRKRINKFTVLEINLFSW